MKKFFFYLIAVILLIQVIRPTKNSNNDESENAIKTVVTVPNEVQDILKRSCNDCHSNNTTYLWYHNIAPISFVVAHHVKEGKEHLNFDEWGTYNADQKKHIIDDLKEAIETREMPIIGYLKLHPEAVISDNDNQILLDWINTLQSE